MCKTNKTVADGAEKIMSNFSVFGTQDDSPGTVFTVDLCNLRLT